MHRSLLVALAFTLSGSSGPISASPPGETPVSLDRLAAWRTPHGTWLEAKDAAPAADDEKKLTAIPGQGVLVNGPDGRTGNLISVAEFSDITAHIEFMVPKGSNSGVYFMGRYEIQVFDSWGKESPQYGDCGGIYQRSGKEGKGFEGRPPRVNASRAPGAWQSFDVIFKAPRFDAQGNKTADAVFVKVTHNGQVVHENQVVTGPTRAASFNDEKARGPLMFQGDHGPVAYRNIQIQSTPNN